MGHTIARSVDSRQPRLRVGFLFDSFWDDFEAKIWRGVIDEARAQDINLVCFAGGALRSPLSIHRNRAVLHDMIGPQNIDGLLVLAGCLGTFLTFEETRQYIERFSSVPMISLSTLFEDIPSIVVDNRSGMHDLVAHFVTTHRCRRIAFLAGPAGNFDADERLGAYKQALISHAIPVDPELIVQGNFMYGCGEAAMFTLVKERRVAFDALIAANDHMAIDALRALQRMDISIPKNVLVGGFDDMKDSYAAMPSLTTVRQPTYELGRRAVRDMVKWLDTGIRAKTVKLPTRLVVRASCGCLDIDATSYEHTTHDEASATVAPAVSVDDAVPMLISQLCQRFGSLTDILDSDTWAHRLLAAYLAEHRGNEGALRSMLAELMKESRTRPIGSGTWGEVLHFLLGLMESWLPCHSRVRDSVFLFVNQYVETRQTGLWLEYEMQTAALQRFQQPISTSFELQDLGAIVRETLPNVGITAFSLCLFENGMNARDAAHLALQFEHRSANDQVVRAFHANEAPRFPTQELLPGGLRDREAAYHINLFSVSFEDEHFGFALYEIGNLNAELYEIVNSQLISLTKGVRLLEETKNYTHKLEHDVAARTAELRLANEMLQKANALMQLKNLEIEKLNEELMEKSKLDSLTNIYNRRAILELLKTELNRTQRSQRRDQSELAQRSPSGERRATSIRVFSVMMLDLDHFKQINDTYGHLVGDQVLKRVGELLKEANILRQVDTPGRFGGEEFIVILPDTTAESAELAAQRLVERLKSVTFHGKAGESFSVTASIGISQFRAEDDHEDAVIHRADQALYYAKNHGRDRIVNYDDMP
jgi:diguanylate cyclase (GGDEF)-like protein